MPSVVSRGRGRRAMNDINMVPFIDVMLVLLIIFMVTATVITPGAIDVPKAGKSSDVPKDYVRVEIHADGAFKSNRGQHTSMEPAGDTDELAAHVKSVLADNAKLPVLLAADKNVKYEQVIDVMSKLRQAGVEKIALSVK